MAQPIFIPLEMVSSGKPPYPPVLALGFRPFYLLAAAWLVFAIPMWLLIYGHGLISESHLLGPTWHAHEMLWGFTSAVIVGFLFTAVSNWTNRPTPRGWPLLFIASLWLAARILLLTPWSEIGALVETLFFVAAAIGIAQPLFRSGNRRNYFFVGLLLIFALLSAAHHYSLLTTTEWFTARQIEFLMLTVVLLIITVITGRIMPMFTANAIQGAPVHKRPWLDRTAVVATLAMGLSLVFLPETISKWIALVAAFIHLFRWWGWAPHWTLRKPIVWILHGSYLWMPIGFLLYAIPGSWSPMASLLATHALTVGLIAGLCIGMMTRTARGHTGRPLQASKAEVTAYILTMAAAIIRVLLPMIWPEWYRLLTSISGLLLTIAFAIYLVKFFPWLAQPRADRKPG